MKHGLLKIGQKPETVEERYEHALQQIASGHDWDATTGLYESSPRLSRRAMRKLAQSVLDLVDDERVFNEAVAAYVARGETREEPMT